MRQLPKEESAKYTNSIRLDR